MAPAKGIRIGGRQKGTPNKVNVATRERIMREADPIAFWRSDHVPGKCRSVQLLTPFPIKPERLLCGLHHPKLTSGTERPDAALAYRAIRSGGMING
jgi:hypothetical protein